MWQKCEGFTVEALRTIDPGILERDVDNHIELYVTCDYCPVDEGKWK